MPWREHRTMSLKIEFVERAKRGEKVARLCREFGISRTTGHKWVQRFEEQGYDGLEEQSRRPKSAPLGTAEDIVLAVLAARDAHPRWGPRKLEVLLRRKLGEHTPSERTIARVLKRAERVRSRRRRRPPNIVERAPSVRAQRPNDVWTVDFKGWWRASNGQRCEPLTVRDAFSRYVLATVLCRTSTEPVREVFERLFRRFGVPSAIQCDNGIPFISVRSPGGLSRLSAWWVSLGIRIVRSRPACPQDNGGHERMHVDLRADVQTKAAETLRAQQRALDRWRQQFNHVRPHQALGGKTPAEVYKPKDKRAPRSIRYRYDPGMKLVRVFGSGSIRYGGERYFLSSSLVGHVVAIEPIDALHVRVWLHDVELAILEVVPSANPAVFNSTLKRKREVA